MTMNKYKDLYKWMIVPMIIMQLGIFMDYWGDLTLNAWSVHVHYWTGTAWYLFLIIQPYYATHGQIARHRTVGIIGMFLAGGVCLTALSMLHRDIVSADRSLVERDQFGPFEPWFFFGVAVVEIVMMTAFGYAVIKSIIHRKEIENHSWWLISTVFLIMMPALARGMQFLYIGLNFASWPNIDIMLPAYVCQLMILVMIVFAAWKFGTLRHPATYLAMAVNIIVFFLEPIGRSETLQAVIRSLIKG
jgi:hypothetical protein